MSFYEYSSDYLPACPICEIYLGPVGEEPTLGPLNAILDTGSDMAIIPIEYLNQIGAKRLSQRRARSVWGDFRPVELYAVSFRMDNLRFKALRVLADDVSDEIIVGRFVLNRLKIVLDGPAGMLEIMQ